jgi:hypothetical protein
LYVNIDFPAVKRSSGRGRNVGEISGSGAWRRSKSVGVWGTVIKEDKVECCAPMPGMEWE